MKFFGVIEADGNTSFMLNMPILGLGVTNDGKYCMGYITGDIEDMATSGHVSLWGRGDFKAWVNELTTRFQLEELPKEYKIEVCTYREACERALKLYEDTVDIATIGGPTVKMDLTLIKNKLRNIL